MLLSKQKISRDLVALISAAVVLQRHRGERCEAWAGVMEQRGLIDAASLFTRLAGVAGERGAMLKRWAEDPGDPAAASLHPDVPWENAFGMEPPDTRLSTSYQILAAAVAGEVAAFRFFSYMAANAADQDVVEYAEMLALGALKQAAMLRRERRLAYHDRRRGAFRVQLPGPGLIRNLNDLRYGAAIIEKEAAALLDKAAAESPETGPLAAAARTQADSTTGKYEANDELAAAFDTYRELCRGRKNQDSAVLTTLETAIDHAKQTFAFYDEVVRQTDDEATMLKAQSLSSLALKRIQALNELLPPTPGSEMARP